MVVFAWSRQGQRAGYASALLCATPPGFPLYQRLGFETVVTAELFGWEGAR